VRRTNHKHDFVLKKNLGFACLQRRSLMHAKTRRWAGEGTSMSRQVAKKPRSDASSNISMANDRELPVCSTIRASNCTLHSDNVFLLYLGAKKNQQPRWSASMCIRIFGNRGTTRLSLGQTQSCFNSLDLFAPFRLETAVPSERVKSRQKVIGQLQQGELSEKTIKVLTLQGSRASIGEKHPCSCLCGYQH
jgi:hypothetical protein